MSLPQDYCPECDESQDVGVSRRKFLASAGALALAAGAAPLTAWADAPIASVAKDAASATATAGVPETLVKQLYDTLSKEQAKNICFDWDFQHPKRGLLRTFVANNWNITPHEINSQFYSKEQQALVRKIFEGIVQPDWHARIDKQLQDDAGGFGHHQAIAIFGKPGDGKFEFVLTGRHMTLRCDGSSADHVAFGGPIFYGHAAQDFQEAADHPGNVFWPQAQAANKLFEMLDGRQRKLALVETSPRENAVAFAGANGKLSGISAKELSSDQQEHLQKVLAKLIEPYRKSDQDEALACLAKQGGLEKCSLAFYRDQDIGKDGVWDNWRLEGPSFVWYFRGSPHVHVWVNVADDPSVKTNS